MAQLQANTVAEELDRLQQAAHASLARGQPSLLSGPSTSKPDHPVEQLLQAHMHLSQLIASGRHPQLEQLRPRVTAFNASVRESYASLSASMQQLQVRTCTSACAQAAICTPCAAMQMVPPCSAELLPLPPLPATPLTARPCVMHAASDAWRAA